MKDLIVFRVATNRYAMDIENIQRIIQASELTSIPNAHDFIDGMMSHEDSVIKVMSFRKLIKLVSYEDELKSLFATLKSAHEEWFESLTTSINTGSEFTKTFDPHECKLGKWLDGFTSYDDNVSQILSALTLHHKELHSVGALAYELRDKDIEQAKKVLNENVTHTFNQAMKALNSFIQELGSVANSLQKLLIYDNKGKKFAIKVDAIEDIAHVEDSAIMASDTKDDESEFLELNGVLELNDVLINVIKTVKLPN